MSTPRTVAFHTLGCKLNYSESSSIAKQFQLAGYEEVAFEQPSDLYIINTCSVTDQADKKCRKAVRAAVASNPHAQVVVIGCYAQLKPEEISQIQGVSLVLGAAEKFNILQHLPDEDLHQMKPAVYSGSVQDVKSFVPSFSTEGRTRSFLKVQDGCDYKCSFCTIPLARGASRSPSIQQVLQTAELLVQEGIKEIVLTGVNIGDFGKHPGATENTTTKENFLELISKLDQIPGEFRYRISSIEPNLCTEEIINFIGNSEKFMPHFHMPLQSGDDEILAKMQRRYKRRLYQERVNYIKKIMPHAGIGVDVITGFPGETDFHFNNTFEFLEGLDVSYLHVFTYSERLNTPAAKEPNQISGTIRKKRSDVLRKLSDDKKNKFNLKNIGTVQQVLIESINQEGLFEAYTPNYIRVAISPPHVYPNTFKNVKLESPGPDHLVLASLLPTKENTQFFDEHVTAAKVY
ncbi:MAG: tRNA (N(6)-L-threonylcarbamoyladenosine(37)-C(2))-methylthiotransferase MtaB [Saprospiraceae bacterium]|nr:tRNA (N(6)-L-threonylcarbamoyladenosine(37)-C(2))-methylthiotransferase MtaB [Saprospiraceae bacterium]